MAQPAEASPIEEMVRAYIAACNDADAGAIASCFGSHADSDEVAWAIRDDLARGYEMMSPGFGASLA
jgi:hypothetical protein